MAINLKIPQTKELRPRITVLGVGGAGGNAVNNMIEARLDGVDFVVANTDAQALSQSKAEHRIQLGAATTEGLGAGAQPDVGRAGAEESLDEIMEHLAGSHMVFITAGMGGGTGTGAQSRHFTFKSCRRLPGGRGLGSRLQEIAHQPIGALAFALEIAAVTGCARLEPRDLRAQCRDPCSQQNDVACLATTRSLWRMAYFGEINAHQGLAVIRARARQLEPLGKRTGRPGRDFQALAQSAVGQNLNGHRLFSSNEPRWNRLAMTG